MPVARLTEADETKLSLSLSLSLSLPTSFLCPPATVFLCFFSCPTDPEGPSVFTCKKLGMFSDDYVVLADEQDPNSKWLFLNRQGGLFSGSLRCVSGSNSLYGLVSSKQTLFSDLFQSFD